jgi:hypothetical protein
MNLKVFKMNSLENVCATSEEEAIEFYAKENDFNANKDQVKKVFLGEIDLNELMWVSIDHLNTEEIGKDRIWRQYASGFLTAITYRNFINRQTKETPFIMMNTDF